MLSENRRKIFNLYNELPFQMKRLFSIGTRIIPSRYIYGRNYFDTYHMIKKTEFLPQQELSKLRDEKLRNILLHAYHTTSFYRREMVMRGIDESDIQKSPEGVLKQLDFTDKELVRENPEGFISKKKEAILNDYVSTGGTSGEPFYFYIDSSRSAKEWAYIVDQWNRVGFELGARRVTFRGSRIRGNYWEDDWLTRERKFSSFELTDEYLNTIWPSLFDYKPEFIYAYPSTMLSLCRFLENHRKKLPLSIKAILLGSENIFEGQREYIEKISGKKVFMWYGHSEKLVLAGECERSNNYHAYPQYGYVEFINEQGETAKPGEFSEIVGTGFINTVMPFIRYRTGDYCTYLGDHCPKCGRNYHIFADVKGRWTQEILYGSKGNPICMSAINVHSNNFRNVFRFQFYQEEKGNAILRLMPRAGFSERDRQLIEDEFNDKFDGNVIVHATVVDDIPLTQRGKYKFIDHKIE